MSKIQTVSGVSNIYASKEAAGFSASASYPIAWECMFVNDGAGKAFAEKLGTAFLILPKTKGHILNFEGTEADAGRCIECVFDSPQSLRQVLNIALKGMVIFDEQKQKITPKQELLDAARNLTQQSKLAMAL